MKHNFHIKWEAFKCFIPRLMMCGIKVHTKKTSYIIAQRINKLIITNDNY